MRAELLAFAALAVAATTFPANSNCALLSRREIKLPPCPDAAEIIDVPEKIAVLEETSARGAGVDSKQWGEKRVECYGSFKPNEEEEKMDYVDPLTPEEAASQEHYELTYYGDMLTDVSFFDDTGSPQKDEENKVASTHMRYDKKGNLVEQSSYDEKGKLMPDWYGYAIYRWEYDDHGRRAGGAFYDAEGRISSRSYTEVAVTHWAHDATDKVVLWVNYDKSGKLTLDILGAAVMRYGYDERGRKAWEATYGTDMRLSTNKKGYSILHLAHDDSGRLTGTVYYGPDKKLTEVGGVAATRWSYNPANRTTETAYYGKDGGLTENSRGFAIMVSVDDDKKQEIERRVYGRDLVLKDAVRYDPESRRWKRLPLDVGGTSDAEKETSGPDDTEARE